MLFVMILTVLAFMVQEMNIALQLAEFVIQVTEPVLTPALLPAIVFAVCGNLRVRHRIVLDLAAVITPVVLPLALTRSAPTRSSRAQRCSPVQRWQHSPACYGDGIILASRSIGIKPINLMLAILPYAGIAAGLSFVLYLVTGFVMA